MPDAMLSFYILVHKRHYGNCFVGCIPHSDQLSRFEAFLLVALSSFLLLLFFSVGTMGGKVFIERAEDYDILFIL